MGWATLSGRLWGRLTNPHNCPSSARPPVPTVSLLGREECPAATKLSDTLEARSTGKKMGLYTLGLHQLAWFCPGR